MRFSFFYVLALLTFYSSISAQHCIRMVSYNVQMLPRTLVHRMQAERAQRIVQKIDSADYDIVFFQEMFDKKMSAFFMNSLNEKYPYKIKNSNKKWLKQGNGLMIWSKTKLEKINHLVFSQAKNWDKMSLKGAVKTITIIHNDTFLLVNTHMQSDYKKQYKHIRKTQLIELKNFIQSDLEMEHILIAGDFNIDNLNDREYLDSDFIKPLKLNEGNTVGTENSTYSPKNYWIKDDWKPCMYDYVLLGATQFYTKNERAIIKFNQYIDKKIIDLSDHYALTATICF